jgi:hypothetical protein
MRLCTNKENSGDSGVVNESDESNNCGPWTDIVVTTPLPTISASLTPDTIADGGTTNFEFSSTGATKCEVASSKTGGAPWDIYIDKNDNITSAGPDALTFTKADWPNGVYGRVTCWNADNVSVYKDVYLTILDPGVSPFGTLTANPTTCPIVTGASTCDTVLTWDTTNPFGNSAITTNVPTSRTVFIGNTDSKTTPVPYNNGNQVPYFLYNAGKELAQVWINVDCAAGANKWDTIGDVCANPLVDSATVLNNYNTPAQIQFKCLNSNDHEIRRDPLLRNPSG